MARKDTAPTGFKPVEASSADRSAETRFRPIEVEFSEPAVTRKRPEAPRIPATTPAAPPQEHEKPTTTTGKKEK